jgi:hypothetical protein
MLGWWRKLLKPSPAGGRPSVRANCTRCRIQDAVLEAYREAVMREDLTRAVEAALAGDWKAAHEVAQRYEHDRTACWLHAVLHKMEPDEDNARYWYRKAGDFYESYTDPQAELRAIRAVLTY